MAIVMKSHIEVGNEMIEVEFGDLLCLRCKHFDIKAYERDIVENKRSYSWDACKSMGVIWNPEDGSRKVVCSSFEEK